MRPELAESSPPPLFSFFFQDSFGTAVGGSTRLGIGGLAVLATTSTRAPDKKPPKIDSSNFLSVSAGCHRNSMGAPWLHWQRRKRYAYPCGLVRRVLQKLAQSKATVRRLRLWHFAQYQYQLGPGLCPVVPSESVSFVLSTCRFYYVLSNTPLQRKTIKYLWG